MPVANPVSPKEYQPRAATGSPNPAATIAVATSMALLWTAAIVTAALCSPNLSLYTALIGLLATVSVAAYTTINRRNTIAKAAATIAGEVEATVTRVVYPIAYEHGERNATETPRPPQLRVVRIPEQSTRKSS